MDLFSYLLGKKAGGGGGTVNLQNKDVTVTTNGTQDITPDAGYDGIRKVALTTNVQPMNQTKSLTITENTTTTITPDNGYDGLSSVEVITNVSGGSVNLQSKSVSITSNGITNVVPDTGYDGLSDVEINTNIEYQDYWPSNLNRSYSNNTSSPAWGFVDTVVSIPAGTYLFTCNNSHVEVSGDNMNNNVNKFICKYSDNVDRPFYFGGQSCGFVFTSEVTKIALYLCQNTTLSNIQLLKIK